MGNYAHVKISLLFFGGETYGLDASKSPQKYIHTRTYTYIYVYMCVYRTAVPVSPAFSLFLRFYIELYYTYSLKP